MSVSSKATSSKSEKSDVSDDSFESDSDFEDIDENLAMETGRVAFDEDEGVGFKKKSWHARMAKRYSRKLSRTSCGKNSKKIKKSISEWRISVIIYDWYNGLYNGFIMLLIAIGNLITIPYIHYFESVNDEDMLRRVTSVQLAINLIYLFDLIMMFIVFGWKATLFKRSWALRSEVFLILGLGQFVTELKEIYSGEDHTHTTAEATVKLS